MSAKQDTVYISDTHKAIRFDAIFSLLYAEAAKEHIQRIRSEDPDNYKELCNTIKNIIKNDFVCDPDIVRTYLKPKGLLHLTSNYKMMFMIYFRELMSMSTWAKQVYYITNSDGRFVYVEFKHVYHGKHMVFNQSMLKDIPITKSMMKEYRFTF